MCMKKLVVTGFTAMALGFLQPAMACGDGPLTGDFSNGNVHVRVTSLGQCGSPFLYQAWNAPRKIGQGKADWVMQGTDDDMNDIYRIVFKRGNTTFHMMPDGDCDDLACDANLDIYINGKKQQHLFLRRIYN